jgi:hypothetical protein
MSARKNARRNPSFLGELDTPEESSTKINNPELGKGERRGNEAERDKSSNTSNMRETSAGYPVKDTRIDDHPSFGV